MYYQSAKGGKGSQNDCLGEAHGYRERPKFKVEAGHGVESPDCQSGDLLGCERGGQKWVPRGRVNT